MVNVICSILIAGYYFYSDPPSSQAEHVTYCVHLSAAWLYFIVVAITTFISLALIIIMLNILLRNNKYEYRYNVEFHLYSYLVM